MRRSDAIRASPSRSSSTLKWPELHTIAPSFIAAKCSERITWMLPVSVMKRSPTGAASAIGRTSNPSIRASSAATGFTSVTITWDPAPRARMATPRPHQP